MPVVVVCTAHAVVDVRPRATASPVATTTIPTALITPAVAVVSATVRLLVAAAFGMATACRNASEMRQLGARERRWLRGIPLFSNRTLSCH